LSITWANERRTGIGGVYEIQNLVNGKRYIGSTVNFIKRKSEHLRKLAKGVHHSPYLQRSFDLYGAPSFVFRRLIVCEPFELVRYEQAVMNIRKHEYNNRLVAESNLGVKLSDVTCRKMSVAQKAAANSTDGKRIRSEINKGRALTQEHRVKLSVAHKGIALTEETKRKLSLAHKGKGRPVDEVTRNKIRMTLMGRPLSEERKAKISQSKMGSVASEETKRKMSESQRRRLGR
jgi:group I intron endonuclease